MENPSMLSVNPAAISQKNVEESAVAIRLHALNLYP
ncbi:hypothetical protein HNQ64_003201 [Prosthecobacter dejongeii]|uniref:Uncharacterized protein n=1 Tax=Prosthecobacter dejongeii TaxID=48465 RepID=A0A7W7YMH8_9BACT|nr:hypothetical protein [Prosthecobacter dejongeii]